MVSELSLLFLTYVNNLPSQVSGGVLLQYADDTTLICFAPDTQEVNEFPSQGN